MKIPPGRTEKGASLRGPIFGRASLPIVCSVLAAAVLAATPVLAAAQAVSAGRVHVVWDAEQTRDNPEGVLAYVVDDAGNAMRLLADPGTGMQRYHALDRLRVEVQGGALLPGPLGTQTARVGSLLPLEAPARAGTSGADRLDFVTVLCRFADDPAEPMAPSRLERVVGPDYPGMRQYYAELSLNPGIMAGNSVTPVWYTLPQPRSFYVQGTQAALSLLAGDCTRAAEADVDFSVYHGINLQFGGALSTRAVAPYDVLSFGGSWTLTLNGQTRVWGMTWMSIQHAENYVVYAHEMGHALGWPHSSGRYGLEYDSHWDVMSRGYLRYLPPWGWLTVHTVGAYKDARGWIPAARRWAPAMGSVESGTLVRPSQPPDAGYLLAVIGNDPERFYTVEARGGTGHEVGVPGQAIVLHEVNRGRAYVIDTDLNGNPNDEGAMWTAGETFSDSLAGLTLRVDAETAEGFDVTITRGWTLNVSATGEGEVEVRAGTANGILCPSEACSHLFSVRGTSVRLLAVPRPGWALRGWGGDCAGYTSCTVTMGSTRTVTALFTQQLAMPAVLARLFSQPYVLSVDDLLLLDEFGNKNGRFDLGDARAWLMYTGALPDATLYGRQAP